MPRRTRVTRLNKLSPTSKTCRPWRIKIMIPLIERDFPLTQPVLGNPESLAPRERINLKQRDFIGLKDFKKAELEGLLDLAAALKTGEDNEKYLQDKFLGMLFTVASTRTRISFQVGEDS